MIIADEPSNGLDAAARDFMLQTLDTTVRNGQRSVLMASHLMDDVEQVCERIVLLHKGRLVAEGKIEDLKAIDREYEVHVWGAADAMERGMLDRGLRVRRQGRVMRVATTATMCRARCSKWPPPPAPKCVASTPTRPPWKTCSSPSWNGLATTSSPAKICSPGVGRDERGGGRANGGGAGDRGGSLR